MNEAEKNYQVIRQVEDGRRFMLEMYARNPALLKTAEQRIRELFQHTQATEYAQTPKQRGISLIELIMFIVIVSVALAGILLVMNVTTKGSADPLIHKQAIAAAESLLEEIELQDFIDQNDEVTTNCPSAASAVTPTNRASYYHIVDCYNGFTMPSGITDLNNNPVGLNGYSASVAIIGEALGTIAAGSAVRITVTVTGPQSNQIAIDGYRTRY